jgi:hypothetical protein
MLSVVRTGSGRPNEGNVCIFHSNSGHDSAGTPKVCNWAGMREKDIVHHFAQNMQESVKKSPFFERAVTIRKRRPKEEIIGNRETLDLVGNDDRIVREQNDVLLDVLPFDYRVVVERELNLLSVHRAHDIDILAFSVIGEAPRFG